MTVRRFALLIAPLVTLPLCAAPATAQSPDGRSAGAVHASYRRPPQLRDGWSTATPESLGLSAAPLEAMSTRNADLLEEPSCRHRTGTRIRRSLP